MKILDKLFDRWSRKMGTGDTIHKDSTLVSTAYSDVS